MGLFEGKTSLHFLEQRANSQTEPYKAVFRARIILGYSDEQGVMAVSRSVNTPASWLNQVEIWFGILSRKALRGASFSSVAELRNAIEAFIAKYSQNPHPFKWRKREVRGSQLKNTIVNLRN